MVLLAVLGARAMVAELQPALGGDNYALHDSQHGPLHNTSIGSSRAVSTSYDVLRTFCTLLFVRYSLSVCLPCLTPNTEILSAIARHGFAHGSSSNR
jgi:hypothetical protein